jgi:sporulation protein YlmC with PRC-barrel domain
MKTFKRSLIISLVPLIAPMSAFAEPIARTEKASNQALSKVTSSSWRASQVIGTNVKNAGDETIGDVEDLVVDMTSGEILAVVVSSGGFLGIADTLSSIPTSALRYDTEAKAFKTKMTKEDLAKVPQFKNTDWPDYNDKEVTEKLRGYRDSVGGDVTAPDNSAQNEKEMKKDAANPMDQGNSERDIKITKDIRSAIMDKDLSFDAKNVKIITNEGRVILKGVVKNHEEHLAVLEIAKSHADASKITDDLKMKED